MNDDLETLVSAARSEFAAAATPADLDNAKARYLGKSGRVTELLKTLGALSAQDKKARGARINAAKQEVEAALARSREAHRQTAGISSARWSRAQRPDARTARSAQRCGGSSDSGSLFRLSDKKRVRGNGG